MNRKNLKKPAAAIKKRKHTGAGKRAAQRRVGRRASLQSLDAATPALSAAAQEANARSALAGGHAQRAEAGSNAGAFQAIKILCVRFATALQERGLPKVGVQGAQLLKDRLQRLVEEEALGAAASPSAKVLDNYAFVSKRREAVIRVAPGPGQARLRAKFGIDQPMRLDLPRTVKAAAEKLIAGRTALPHSRAAKLLTPDDEKKLRALARSIQSNAAETRAARKEGIARTTERDILSCALELFYDDFAASIGLVLEGDEVARLAALNLVPRRPDRRTAAAAKSAGTDAPKKDASGGSTAPQGSEGG